MSGESWPTDTTRPQNVFVMPPVPSPFIMTLPLPPSVNRLKWGLGNKSPIVQDWIEQCDRYVLAMKPLTHFKGPCALGVVWPEDGKFDVDNRVKPLMDYLQRIEVVNNDRQFRELYARYGYVPRGFCRVEIHANW